MSNILFGYDNMVDDGAVAFTKSTEAAGFEVKNIQAVAASQPFRTSAPSAAYVHVNTGGIGKVAQLVAVVGHEAARFSNLLRYVGDLTDGVWTKTNLPATNSTTSSPAGEGTAWSMTETTDGGAVTHSIEQTWTKPLGVATELSVTGWTSGGFPLSRNVRVEMIGASGAHYARLDVGPLGAEVASSVAGSFSGLDTSVTLDDTYSKFRLTATTDAHTAVTVRFTLLEQVNTTPYTGSGITGAKVYGAQLSPGSNHLDYAETQSANGAVWRVVTAAADAAGWAAHALFASDLMTMAPGGDVRNYSSASCFYEVPTANSWVLVDMFDPNNANSQIDIGRLFVGPVLQPTVQTVTMLDMDYQNGRRINTYGMNFITKTEATGAFAEMARKLDIRPGQKWESMDGQVSIPRQGAVVVIANPEETVNPSEELLYGYITKMSRAYRQSGRSYSVTHGVPLYSFSVTVEEIIP